jgi:hypothetical protein
MVARNFAGRTANLFRIARVELNVVAVGTTVWSQSQAAATGSRQGLDCNRNGVRVIGGVHLILAFWTRLSV